jgi:DNA-binding NarL/FixJ family response regulator
MPALPNVEVPARMRVLLADDHEAYRHAIAEVINAELDMQVVAEVSDGEQAVDLARYLRPDRLDLVLIDIAMPRLDGICAVEQLNLLDPELPVIMLTVSLLDRSLFDAVEAGAVGYLSKGVTPGALVRALRDFHRDGGLPMSRVMARKVLAYFRGQPLRRLQNSTDLASELSPREHQVLALIAQGAHDREIAMSLVLSERTVKKHVENILRKLHARNRAAAAAHFQSTACGGGSCRHSAAR